MTLPRVTETTPVPQPVEPDTFGGAVTQRDAAAGWPPSTDPAFAVLMDAEEA